MNATSFHGALAYHDYEGVSFELDERPRLLKDLGEHTAMMLKNHGLLTTGRTVAEAFLRLYRLERACQTQVDAGAAGTISVMGDNVAGKSRSQLEGFGGEITGQGELEFAALIRKIDKIDTSWRN
jgi:ribulose-5-phosphate 4-epimerase/fuculose-1-phosphate aldolase